MKIFEFIIRVQLRRGSRKNRNIIFENDVRGLGSQHNFFWGLNSSRIQTPEKIVLWQPDLEILNQVRMSYSQESCEWICRWKCWDHNFARNMRVVWCWKIYKIYITTSYVYYKFLANGDLPIMVWNESAYLVSSHVPRGASHRLNFSLESIPSSQFSP